MQNNKLKISKRNKYKGFISFRNIKGYNTMGETDK